jgi:beta-lactamase class D
MGPAAGPAKVNSSEVRSRKLPPAAGVSGGMKILFLMLLSGAAWAEESCYLVADAKSGRAVEAGGALCKERLPPCSTFKLPLAVMAIDAGILDEKTILKWDKTPQHLKAWEQDADAAAWLRESIVWFSQRLTSQLGMARVQKYLDEFAYGNRDFTGGLTTAWLESTLKISAEEQLALLLRLQQGRLLPDAARRAIALLPGEGEVRGKTGSCADEKVRIGWYVGYARNQAFVYVFREPRQKGDRAYAGLDAKKWVLARLQ